MQPPPRNRGHVSLFNPAQPTKENSTLQLSDFLTITIAWLQIFKHEVGCRVHCLSSTLWKRGKRTTCFLCMDGGTTTCQSTGKHRMSCWDHPCLSIENHLNTLCFCLSTRCLSQERWSQNSDSRWIVSVAYYQPFEAPTFWIRTTLSPFEHLNRYWWNYLGRINMIFVDAQRGD